MLKITTTVADGAFTLAIAGRLTLDGCHAVNRILNDDRNRGRQVRVDLAGIRLVDQSSVEYLADIRRHHAVLVNLPSYISRWVDQVSSQYESEHFGGA